MLPVIRRALGPDFPIVFDSGVRSADDIIRAIALGANFVMLGRPILFALGAAGSEGLDKFLTTISDDLVTVMGQLGLTSIDQISRDIVDPPKGNFDD